jgi:hypothetical protein
MLLRVLVVGDEPVEDVEVERLAVGLRTRRGAQGPLTHPSGTVRGISPPHPARNPSVKSSKTGPGFEGRASSGSKVAPPTGALASGEGGPMALEPECSS